MLIALIGMSGSGKSLWSEKLAAFGFRRFCCDDLITEKLSTELIRHDGGSMSLGEWMGFPFQPDYERKEALYLACEQEVLAGVLDWITAHAAGCSAPEANVVVDTTGSVIYTGEPLLRRLKSLTTIVNFTTPPEVRESMLRQYMANPRPVLWRGLFSSKNDESDGEALFRSYNLLLDAREALYHRLADIEIDYITRSNPDFTVSQFLKLAGEPGAGNRCKTE
ncbi:MAG: shikimate kinase [Syntrophobacteraceae bacterium]